VLLLARVLTTWNAAMEVYSLGGRQLCVVPNEDDDDALAAAVRHQLGTQDLELAPAAQGVSFRTAVFVARPVLAPGAPVPCELEVLWEHLAALRGLRLELTLAQSLLSAAEQSLGSYEGTGTAQIGHICHCLGLKLTRTAGRTAASVWLSPSLVGAGPFRPLDTWTAERTPGAPGSTRLLDASSETKSTAPMALVSACVIENGLTLSSSASAGSVVLRWSVSHDFDRCRDSCAPCP
jgi:hypothetical protein